jgi:hypothetical protein
MWAVGVMTMVPTCVVIMMVVVVSADGILTCVDAGYEGDDDEESGPQLKTLGPGDTFGEVSKLNAAGSSWKHLDTNISISCSLHPSKCMTVGRSLLHHMQAPCSLILLHQLPP